MKKLRDSVNIILNVSQKKRLAYLILLISIGSSLEVIGVGLIVPAVITILDPSFIQNLASLEERISLYIEPTHSNLVFLSMFMLFLFYILKSFFLIYMTIQQGKFTYEIKEKIGERLFNSYIRKPYPFFLVNNTSRLIRNLTTETANLGMIVRAMLTLVVDGILFIFIVAILLYVEPVGTISIALLLLISAGIYQRLTQQHLLNAGKQRQFHDGKKIQHIQQGISSIKDVKILGKEEEFLDRFFTHNHKGVIAERLQFILAAMPRLFLEFIVILGLIILVLILFIDQQDQETSAVVLGIYAVAIFRLLPSINRILGAAQKLRFALPSLTVVLEELSDIEPEEIDEIVKIQPEANKKIDLNYELKLTNLYFQHDSSDIFSIKDLNLELKAHTSLGVFGGSGAGKSTMIDLIMGLLEPTEGKITIDGKDIKDQLSGWQKNIGYVAQTIYLTDDSIKRNIAFGVTDQEIDEDRVRECIVAAKLEDVIEALPAKSDTEIGERGVRLSGGQRQRIGIARALYHDPSVLIFDEATSSLDFDTELEVMETINALQSKKTIIIVSHRINTLSECDVVVQLHKGSLKEIGNFQTVIGKEKGELE